MIHTKRINSIDILSFDSPNGNLLSLQDIEYLISYIDIAQKNSEVKGIILTGRGRSFSAGLNISSLIENFSEEASTYFFKSFDTLLLNLFKFPKPIVAAVNGHSIGGGLLILCCADYIVITDNPKIKLGLPELKLGLTIDELMKELLIFNLSNNKTLSKLLYSSEYYNPQQFREYGLIDEVVLQEKLILNCLEHIQLILEYDSKAFNITKQIIKSDCKEKMQFALNNNSHSVYNGLLTKK